MNKQAISITLDPANLLWLRAQTLSQGRRSISETLDRLIREARTESKSQESPVRSVVGAVRIAESDPNLDTADTAVREFFSSALTRKTVTARNRTVREKAQRRSIAKDQ
jgi:carbamate kinase